MSWELLRIRTFFFAAAFVGLRADDLASAHATHAPRTGRSHSFAGQLAGLLHPSGELSFVELVVLVDVEVARVLALGLAGGDGTQRRAAEESHLGKSNGDADSLN